jgi:DNA (cytosine-5)-methyltransferase 1
MPYMSAKDLQIIEAVRPGGNYMDVPDDIATKRILHFKETGGRTTTYGRLDRDCPSYTLNSYFSRPNVGCNIHYQQDRLITVREGLRLQSFPDSFTVLSTSRRSEYIQVGNAVPPLLAASIAEEVLKTIG